MSATYGIFMDEGHSARDAGIVAVYGSAGEAARTAQEWCRAEMDSGEDFVMG
jgi:hypothetical protein